MQSVTSSSNAWIISTLVSLPISSRKFSTLTSERRKAITILTLRSHLEPTHSTIIKDKLFEQTHLELIFLILLFTLTASYTWADHVIIII